MPGYVSIIFGSCQELSTILEYRDLSKIHPWAMNLGGSSKRGVGLYYL